MQFRDQLKQAGVELEDILEWLNAVARGFS